MCIACKVYVPIILGYSMIITGAVLGDTTSLHITTMMLFVLGGISFIAGPFIISALD